MDVGGSEHSGEVVIIDGSVFDGRVHGTFGADDTLFEAQEGGEVGGGGAADGNRHAAKLRLVFKEIFHFRDKHLFLAAGDFDSLVISEDDGAAFAADVFADMLEVHEE